jgi:hypothetical protein
MLLLSGGAHAGTILTYDVPVTTGGVHPRTRHGSRVYRVDGAHARADVSSPLGERAILIDVAQDRTVWLDPRTKSYNDGDGSVSAQFGPDQGLQYEPLGRQRKIGGVVCQMYREWVGGRAFGEMCVMSWSDRRLAGEGVEVERALTRFAREFGFGQAGEGREFPGVPVAHWKRNESGALQLLEQLRTIRHATIPAERLRVPATYHAKARPQLHVLTTSSVGAGALLTGVK